MEAYDRDRQSALNGQSRNVAGVAYWGGIRGERPLGIKLVGLVDVVEPCRQVSVDHRRQLLEADGLDLPIFEK